MSKVTTGGVVQEVLESLDNMLRQHHFRVEDPGIETDEFYWRGWRRGPGWRQDVVRCSWDKHLADRLVVHLISELLIDNEKWTMDGTTGDYVSGRPAGAYFLPNRLILALRGGRLFIKNVVEDTRRALSWFDQFATPASCIRRLESGAANFAAPGTEAFNTVVQHLRILESMANRSDGSP